MSNEYRTDIVEVLGIDSETCAHVEGPSIAPGWGCCKCRVYNGYQRPKCKNCGHWRCEPDADEEP